MSAKRIIRISYMTMLTVIGGLIRLPVGEIAFTLQTLFVVLSGLLLGPVDGLISQAAYMLLGLVGLPVFTAGGGLSYVLQPSFGYIISFLPSAFLSGALVKKSKVVSVKKAFLIGLIGLVPVYLIGPAYQIMIFVAVNGMPLSGALLTIINVAVYLVVDIIIIYIAALIYPRLSAYLGQSEQGREKNKKE